MIPVGVDRDSRVTGSGSAGGNIGMFRYNLVREIRSYSRERSGFAGICVEIFGRLAGSRVPNGNIGMFRYGFIWEIRGYLRERSAFAAICVEILAPF